MKLRNLRTQTRAFILIGSTFLLLVCSSVYVIWQILNVAEQTKLLYNHPFAVSNAIYRIQGNLYKFQLICNEIEDSETFDKQLVLKQDSLTTKINQDFRLLNERFLGEKDKISTAEVQIQNYILEEQKKINVKRTGS